MEYGLRHLMQSYHIYLVLILVVMEYGLRHIKEALQELLVLILVVMEYGLRQIETAKSQLDCLNPCCNGIWSQTRTLPGEGEKGS